MSQNQLATWLNEAGMVDGQKKSEILRKVQELLIHQVPHLLPSYLDNLLMYSTDRNQDVKKQVVTFIEEISKFHPNYIPKVVSQLRLLLLDGVVATQKRVIQASGTIYKQALNWICSGNADTREMQFVWEQLNELKLHILNMIDNDNEGIRTNSIKFLEGVIILQTYSSDYGEKTSNSFSLDNIPASLLFINRRKLEEESEHIFKLLLKFHNSQHISSVNLMACMTALCNLAKERPKYIPRVLQALGDLHTTLPPTLSQSQVNSVRKHLKMLLINLVKHPSSQEMLPQLTQLLSDIGMTSQEIAKAIPREKRNKRVIELKHEESSSKRPRIDSPQSNSQGSDKSETSILNDDSDDSKSMHASTVTEDSIFEGLHNIENVISLVTQTLKHLPAEAPPNFLKLYKPIPNSGSAIQKRALSKLIVANIKDEPTSMPPALVDNPFRIPLLKDKDEDEKLSLKNAVAKLAETEKLEREIENAVSKLMEESKQEKLIPPPTPTVPKLKQRVKLLKLQEITKPVPNNMKEKLMAQAVNRILQIERDSAVGGVCHIRNKLLVTFATTYTSEIRELILSHVIENVAARIDLAISWLYEEYSYMQGFTRQPLTLNPIKPNEKHDQNYNNLLCALITHIGERDEPNLEEIKDGLLRRVYLETPVITDDAIEFLKHLVCEEHKSLIALDLLEEIIIRRPPNANKYISALLCHTINENEEIREKATQSVLKIYMRHNESLKKIVEKNATLYLGFLSLSQPPVDLFQAESGRIDMPRTWNDNLYKVCLNLYLGLFPANEGLILELARVYAGAGPDAKRCVLRALEGPMRNAVSASQGTPSAAFLELIEECPRGAETLITRVVHIITEKYSPSPELVSRVRDLYATRVSDIRFLIPVLNGLTKKEIVAALPKLIKLNPVVVKEVFNKLLGLQSTREENLPVSPSELLVAVHLIDPAKAELKYIIKATALCLAEKQTYTQEVLAIVLQQLMECTEIPVLLMRTVLQVLTLYPKLSGFIMNILQRLIGKQVWLNRVAWEGFIKCCERTLPQSLTILLTLPPQAIHSVVTTSTILMSKLSAHVQIMTPAQKAHLQPEVLSLLCKDNAAEAPMEVVNVPTIDNFEEVQYIGGGNPPEFKPVEPILEPMSEPLPPGMD